ncbi:hypothetical protein GYMLUDRAFT_43252 [Collybiopsis luxurians FD-317 M1]|uniref:Uncharacterized protein n=1 Tax=Collybiopsis luxurians FD-317 M1 TaxID=944289 RepID=A0A0D0CF15_9AGAR|nr:hypothetical protein GYMLUDRAFT_43252 [Collybiopsis luxurians FD-317 M1]
MSTFTNDHHSNENLPGNRLEAVVEAQLSSLSIRLSDLGRKKPFCGHSLTQLNNGLKDSLNLLKSEYLGAPGSRQEHFLPLFTYFETSLARCEELVERLNKRNVVLAIVYFVHDSKIIKNCNEEVKQKGLELRGRISRLKEHWPNDTCSPQASRLPSGSIGRDHSQFESSSSSDPPHTSTPSSSRSLMMTGPQTLSNASVRSIQTSQFNSAANNMHNTTHNYPPSVVNNGGSVVFNFYHGHGHGQSHHIVSIL